MVQLPYLWAFEWPLNRFLVEMSLNLRTGSGSDLAGSKHSTI